LIRDQKLDAITAISGGPAWLVDFVNGDAKSWDSRCSSPAAVSGYPHITVPGGDIFGLPVGISFFAKAWREPTLLRIAYAFEQAMMARKQPKYLPNLDFGAL
jgi:amidase